MNAKAEVVTVPPLESRPPSLLYADLHQDPNNWRNAGMAAFFGKGLLIMKK
jgi:hypothetical protein